MALPAGSLNRPHRRLVGGAIARPGYDGRVVKLLDILRRPDVEWRVALPSGESFAVKPTVDPPDGVRAKAEVTLRSRRVLRGPITEYALGRAYVGGDIDVELLWGDRAALFGVREGTRDGIPLRQAARVLTEAVASPAWANRRAIRRDYELPNEFFHTFLDRDYHLYSQGRFASEGETLEASALNKLEHVAASLELQQGMRILDVGAGWGGLTSFCTRRGVHVTSLTLEEKSETYIKDLIRSRSLMGEVLREDFLDHARHEAYDHVAVLGVIEHIPTYRRFARRVWEVVKPGGRLYLDASATREKYAGSAFTRRFTWTGPHSCLSLQDMVRELAYHGFDIEHVENNSRDYELTMRGWAERLDRHHPAVAARWGESVYRQFAVFLWGGAYGLSTGRLQAYTVIARRPKEGERRSGLLRRAGHAAALIR